MKSLKTSIQYYDTGSWTRYNRASQELVTVEELAAQVEELHSLHSEAHDTFFNGIANKCSHYVTTAKVYQVNGYRTYISAVKHITNPTFKLPCLQTNLVVSPAFEYYVAVMQFLPSASHADRTTSDYHCGGIGIDHRYEV